MPVTRMFDLNGVQMMRITQSDDGDLVLEIADPARDDGQPMQWLTIADPVAIRRLGTGILEFFKDHVSEGPY